MSGDNENDNDNDKEPNRYKLFAKLREMWKDVDAPIPGADPERTRSSASLAEYLEVPKQRVTQWATGSGGKAAASWKIILKLCADLRLGVSIHPENGASLYKLEE